MANNFPPLSLHCTYQRDIFLLPNKTTKRIKPRTLLIKRIIIDKRGTEIIKNKRHLCHV